MPLLASRQLKALAACAWATAVLAGAWVGPAWHVPDAHPAPGAPVAASSAVADVPR